MAKDVQPPKNGTSSQLQHAWQLFDAGDKVGAQREAKKLIAEHPETPEALEARELIDRTSVPRIGWVLAGVAAGVIALMILLAVLRT